MPIALHHPSNMTFHTNQLLHPFYALGILGKVDGSCDRKQTGIPGTYVQYPGLQGGGALGDA